MFIFISRKILLKEVKKFRFLIRDRAEVTELSHFLLKQLNCLLNKIEKKNFCGQRAGVVCTFLVFFN
jgi:hypothetical protein